MKIKVAGEFKCNLVIKSLIVLIFTFFCYLYILYINKQVIDIFFESQFLHLEFLKDIVDNRLTGHGFFTAYAEHIFPGYNFVLAANYFLYDIWGGFDNYVYAGSLICATFFVIIGVYCPSVSNRYSQILIAFTSILLLLSPTNNPQWGMALSAAIGVVFFVVSIYFIAISFEINSKKKNSIACISIFISIVFFLGGYAVGAVGSILLILTIRLFRNKSIDNYLVIMLSVVLISLVVYVALVNKYGVLFANKPTETTFDLKIIGQFFLLMIGSSLIGKAFLESAEIVWPYYACGGILFYWSLHLYFEYIKNPTRNNIFVIGILTYSLTNVVFVSLFRFRNGLDGAFGQWYNFHTHFIGVAVFYYLISSIDVKKSRIYTVCKVFSSVFLFSFALAGFYSDWKKSEYVYAWKSNFLDQVPPLLAFPDLIKNHHESMNTMLWNYKQAKDGIDFLYDNKLSIFRSGLPLIFGLTPDSWLEQNKPVWVICPVGSKSLTFMAWRPDGWPSASISLRYGSENKIIAVENSNIKIYFEGSKPVVFFNVSDAEKSSPVSSISDRRALVAIVNHISCEDRESSAEKN
jgi:hypothetical protein